MKWRYIVGKVKVQTYNSILIEFADYTDKEVIKKLFMNYEELKRLGKKGDTVAISIYMDLENCISELSNVEADAIKHILIEGYKYREYKELSGTPLVQINRITNRALDRCVNILCKNKIEDGVDIAEEWLRKNDKTYNLNIKNKQEYPYLSKNQIRLAGKKEFLTLDKFN